MGQPTDTFKATLDHIPDTTGRDGAIDFAAKVEASHAERVVLDQDEDFIVHAGGRINGRGPQEGSCRSCCRTRRCDRDRWSRRTAGARTKGVMRRSLQQSRAFKPPADAKTDSTRAMPEGPPLLCRRGPCSSCGLEELVPHPLGCTGNIAARHSEAEELDGPGARHRVDFLGRQLAPPECRSQQPLHFQPSHFSFDLASAHKPCAECGAQVGRGASTGGM
jgi:hypothetical protein